MKLFFIVNAQTEEYIAGPYPNLYAAQLALQTGPGNWSQIGKVVSSTLTTINEI